MRIIEDASIKTEIESKMKSVYLNTTIALIITFSILIMAYSNESILRIALNSFSVLIVAQLAIALSLSGFIYKLNTLVLRVLMFAYAMITGITLSVISAIYSFETVSTVLISTIVLFVVLTAYGYFTRNSLDSYSKFLYVGIISLIIIGIINIFIRNAMADFLMSVLGVVIFVIYTAYDTQKIKNNIYSLVIEGNEDLLERVGIIGSFSLYLDFINLFMYLLRLFGGNKKE